MSTPTPDDKGAYKVVVDEEQAGSYPSSRSNSISSRSPPPPSHLDQLLNHPALPVMCYCASSILMTVRICDAPSADAAQAGSLTPASPALIPPDRSSTVSLAP